MKHNCFHCARPFFSFANGNLFIVSLFILEINSIRCFSSFRYWMYWIVASLSSPSIISASVFFFWMSLGIRIRVRSQLLCSPIITLWWIFSRKLPFIMNYKANFGSYFPLNWPCSDISISKWSRHRTRISITFQLGWRNAIKCVSMLCVKRSQSCCDWNGHVHKPHYHENYFQLTWLDLRCFALRLGWDSMNENCDVKYACANGAFRMHVITTATTSNNSVFYHFSSVLFTLVCSFCTVMWSASIYCFALIYFSSFFLVAHCWVLPISCCFIVQFINDSHPIFVFLGDDSKSFSVACWTTLFCRWYESIIIKKETIM